MTTPPLPPGASIPKPPASTAAVLFEALANFPRFVVLVLIDLVHAAVTDTMSLALTGGSVLLARITGSWMIGAAGFQFVFVGVRAINNLAAAFGASGQATERGLHHLASAHVQSRQPPSGG